MAYDYTVLAGTQGIQNHRKKDRLFELASQLRLPVVFFTEGGGGRPGDTDGTTVALLDCCDVVIATANSSIGMGGPAMIEGGGLGVFHPDEVGPMAVQLSNGVVDIAVADEAEAVRVTKQ